MSAARRISMCVAQQAEKRLSPEAAVQVIGTAKKTIGVAIDTDQLQKLAEHVLDRRVERQRERALDKQKFREFSRASYEHWCEATPRSCRPYNPGHALHAAL
eukprot:6681934-Prymnesium_polylepis.1